MYEFKELAPKIKEILTKAKLNHNYFCTNLLKIATKNDGIKPFILNNIQLDLLNKIKKNHLSPDKKKTFVILKARQQGVSTFVESWIFGKILFNFNRKAHIISHSSSSSSYIFEMTKLFYEYLPTFIKMVYTRQKNNAKILSIKENNSQISVSTAGGREIGRGEKNNYIHASEVAFWDHPNLLLASLIQSVPDNTDNDNLIIYESTANGNNFFREMFEDGLKNKTSIFYAWNQFTDYQKRFKTQ
jgi:hypothetical protein